MQIHDFLLNLKAKSAVALPAISLYIYYNLHP